MSTQIWSNKFTEAAEAAYWDAVNDWQICRADPASNLHNWKACADRIGRAKKLWIDTVQRHTSAFFGQYQPRGNCIQYVDSCIEAARNAK